MDIKNNTYNLNELEHMFAQDLGSPIFPVLAEFYFRLSQFKKAKKVCEVGLRYNPNNNIAEYILAKLFLLDDNYIGAERLLKNVIINNPSNFQALQLFINVKIILERNPATYRKYIKQVYSINPGNKKIKNLYKKLNIKKTLNVKNKKPITKANHSILVNEKLATKTMYMVLIKQKKHEDALELLKIMKKNKKYKVFVKQEWNKVTNLMK